MPRFLDIPLELLAVIFDFVLKPHHLAALCLVSRVFNDFATPILYRRVLIFPWHKNAKSKVISLFETLAKCPRLAAYVQRLGNNMHFLSSMTFISALEVRDFPKGYPSSSHLDLLNLCVDGIKNCINLRSCTWTRDGSLHSDMLTSLHINCSQLQELEINGNSGEYDPIILTYLQKLRKISLIMPSVRVLDVLPAWTSATGATLRSLTLLCKASAVVTDTFLQLLSPNLTNLEQLFIVGCPKVTHRGIEALIAENRDGLLTLNLEALSQSFDMSAFKTVCHRTQALRRLRSITLTLDSHTPIWSWAENVNSLLAPAPLEVFQLYSTDTLADAAVPSDFWKSIVTTHGSRLKRFSVHRMQLSLDTLHAICSLCPLLEQLFVVSKPERDLEAAGTIFAVAKNLRTLHVNFPLAASESSMLPTAVMQAAMNIVSCCSPTLTYIGLNTRVWQVQRIVRVDGNGEKYIQRILALQENPEIPEQFLVVRA